METLGESEDTAIIPAVSERFDGFGDEQESSVIERLRQQRKVVAEQHSTDIDIPGYNGNLFCRYRLLESKDLKSISDHIQKTIRDPEERIIAAGCDTLIRACEEFWVRDNGKEIPVRNLLEPSREFPVRYDTYLATFLGYEDFLPDPPTARAVVLGLFGGNEISLAAHNSYVARWMMGRGTEIDQELGEF
jgi:hypothetical protein